MWIVCKTEHRSATKFISFLHKDASNLPHYLCFVVHVYHVPPGFTPIEKRDGNSKAETPFHPTWVGTKQTTKEECLVQSSDSIVSCIVAEADGIIGAYTPGNLSQNAKQIPNSKGSSLFSYI